MSWEDQGRQEHGWFGTGTSAGQSKTGMFGAGGIAQRAQAVAHGALAALPTRLRSRAAAQAGAGGGAKLAEALTAWGHNASLSRAEFAERFFGRAADDPVAAKLHEAAQDIASASDHVELRGASEKVAAAMQMVGLDQWSRLVADAFDKSSVSNQGGAQQSQLAAAGSLKCEGFDGGCQSGGSFSTSAMYDGGGRKLCYDCALKYHNIQDEPARAKIDILRKFLLSPD